MRQRYVYFAYSRKKRLMKIGVTEDVMQRAWSLGAHCFGWMPGDYTTEKETHARFAHLRVKGEWFEPTDELLAFVTTLEPLRDPAMFGKSTCYKIRARDLLKANGRTVESLRAVMDLV